MFRFFLKCQISSLEAHENVAIRRGKKGTWASRG